MWIALSGSSLGKRTWQKETACVRLLSLPLAKSAVLLQPHSFTDSRVYFFRPPTVVRRPAALRGASRPSGPDWNCRKKNTAGFSISPMGDSLHGLHPVRQPNTSLLKYLSVCLSLDIDIHSISSFFRLIRYSILSPCTK